MSTTYSERTAESHESNEEPTPQEDVKKKIKDKFVEWSQSSTSHGYPNIFRTKNIVVKVMWLIFFLGGLGVGIYMVVKGITEYLQFDVTTTIRNLKNESLTFPAVTICNAHPFKTEAGALYILDYFRKNYGENISSIDDARKAVGDNYQAELEILRQNTVSPYFNRTLRDSFGYSADDMFWNCNLNSVECDYTNFERFYDPFYGNCFRINSGFNESNERIDLVTSNRYSNEGLKLYLFTGPPRTNKSLFLYDYTVFSGMRIVIHDQSIKPYYTEGLFFQTGTYNRITINKVITENLFYPYSPCKDLSDFHSVLYDAIKASNYSYRQFDCFNLCYQKAVIDKCGCYDVDVDSLFDAVPCLNSTQHSCLIEVYYAFKTNSIDPGCENECPLECSSTTFSIEKSFATFPSRDFTETILSIPGLEDYMDDAPFTPETIQQSLIGVHIVFADMQYTSITEQPSLTVIDVIANVGGTLGLFIGISLLSIFEMMEIAIKVLSILMTRKFKGKKSEPKSYTVKI